MLGSLTLEFQVLDLNRGWYVLAGDHLSSGNQQRLKIQHDLMHLVPNKDLHSKETQLRNLK